MNKIDDYKINSYLQSPIKDSITATSIFSDELNAICICTKLNVQISMRVPEHESSIFLEYKTKLMEQRLCTWVADNYLKILQNNDPLPFYEHGIKIGEALIDSNLPEDLIICHPITYSLLNHRKWE